MSEQEQIVSRKKATRADSKTSESESESDDNRRGRSREKKEKKNKKKKGRSVSRSKSREKDRRSGVSPGSRGSATAAAKLARGQKVGPSDWTREELLQNVKKFGKFTVNGSTGVSILVVQSKRVLSNECEVIAEIFRRFTEVQQIILHSCSLTDEVFADILAGMKTLRHVKHLSLQNNLLTTHSVVLIASHFTKLSSSRGLDFLDMRSNNLNAEDGRMLFKSFPRIGFLNGIPISSIKNSKMPSLGSTKDKMPEAADTINTDNDLDLSGQSLAIAECAIVGNLALSCWHLKGINLSKNAIDVGCLKLLVELFRSNKFLQRLDLSYNPLSRNGADLSGLEILNRWLKTSTSLCELNLSGAAMPLSLLQNIKTSLSVNRTMYNQVNVGNYFQRFCYDRIMEKVPPPPANPVTDWEPLLEVDMAFCRLNRIGEVSVSVSLAGSGDSTAGGDRDHILISRTKDTRARITDF